MATQRIDMTVEAVVQDPDKPAGIVSVTATTAARMGELRYVCDASEAPRVCGKIRVTIEGGPE